MWGCMAASGVGTLKFVHGQLDAAVYVRLICHILEEDGRKLCSSEFIFQQDGAPCHRAKSTKVCFQQKKIRVSPWPSQSPDLNPIERLWGEMKKKLDHVGMSNSWKSLFPHMEQHHHQYNRDIRCFYVTTLCCSNCCQRWQRKVLG